MEFIKAKYFAFFFMLVLLTSGFPLNANNDGDILPTADAVVKAPNNGNKIFLHNCFRICFPQKRK